jgi:hypothetical protein
MRVDWFSRRETDRLGVIGVSHHGETITYRCRDVRGVPVECVPTSRATVARRDPLARGLPSGDSSDERQMTMYPIPFSH